MIITHKTPGATETVVIACREFVFVDGVAHAELNSAEVVAVQVRGHTVTEGEAFIPGKKKPKTIQKADIGPDIGADVEVTEQAPPEIG